MIQQMTVASSSISAGRRSLCVALMLALFVPPVLQAQALPQQNLSAPITQTAAVLEPSTPIERELAGGRTHAYQITLTEGQYLGVTVEQRGINIGLQILGPDSKQVAEFDSEDRKSVV